jgi:uncharacterized protein (TIGR02145 family)
VKGASAVSYDWHYASRDDGLWAAEKTIYDPCPAGWRVPDGGESGLWSTAGFTSSTYEAANEGIHFDISSQSTTWYPAAGSRSYDSAELTSVGNYGYYWSITPYTSYACYLYFFSNGSVNPANDNYRSYAFSVRCVEDRRISIASFIAQPEGKDRWYMLTGVVKNIQSEVYGNFDLEDATGSVYVYGLTATPVSTNDQSFSSIGIKEGDTITIMGTRTSYNGTPQVGGPAYYVSHIQ